jgi:hypothetical protein
LEYFKLEYHGKFPNGKKVIMPPPPDDTSDIWPSWCLDDALLNQLYIAAGRAAMRMPRLNLMLLQSVGYSVYNHVFGYEAFRDMKDARVQLFWSDYLKFTPVPEMLTVWKTVARTNARCELEVIDGLAA